MEELPKHLAKSVPLFLVIAGSLIQFPLFDVVRAIIFGMIVGYFVGDVRIALDHFHMDNYRPTDSGFLHHESVVSEGWRFEVKMFCSLSYLLARSNHFFFLSRLPLMMTRATVIRAVRAIRAFRAPLANPPANPQVRNFTK